MIAVKLNLDPSTGLGSFRRRIDGKLKEFSGKILTPAEDFLQIMDSNGSRYETSDYQSDLDPIITEIISMTFPGVKSPDVRSDMKALLLGYSGLLRGVGLIADEEFKINLKPDTDIMRLSQ